jgi:hypothetical protein
MSWDHRFPLLLQRAGQSDRQHPLEPHGLAARVRLRSTPGMSARNVRHVCLTNSFNAPRLQCVKTISIREFFRQPKMVQDWVRRGERVAVARRRRIVFEVHPPSESQAPPSRRKSIGRMAHLPLKGDPAQPLPSSETWR